MQGKLVHVRKSLLSRVSFACARKLILYTYDFSYVRGSLVLGVSFSRVV